MNSTMLWFWLIALTITSVGLAFLVWHVARRKNTQVPTERARQLFEQDEARLKSLFLQAASASGKPRGLRWKECQWSELIEWIRDKHTGQLLALVGVTIAFEAIQGGDMEGVEAVGNLRNASAVFFFQDGQWQTGGRVLFNLNPDEAVTHFKGGYERIGEGSK
jgi:hypothetical protein